MKTTQILARKPVHAVLPDGSTYHVVLLAEYFEDEVTYIVASRLVGPSGQADVFPVPFVVMQAAYDYMSKRYETAVRNWRARHPEAETMAV